jgi:hypothetical protein
LSQRVIIPKTDYPKTFRFKNSRPLGIAGGLLDMLSAIQFHYQPLLDADKINDERWNRVLSPKFESVKVAVLQFQPEPQFGVS